VLDSVGLKRIAPGEPPRIAEVAAESTWAGYTEIASSLTGALWLIDRRRSQPTVVRFDPRSGSTKRFPITTIPFPEQLLEDGAGRVWVAGNGGAEFLDPGADAFRAVGELRGSLVAALEGLPGGGVIALPEVDLKSNPCCTGARGNIVLVDGTGRIAQRWNAEGVVGKGYLPMDITVDSEGGIWVATLVAGLFRFDSEQPLFEHLSSRSSSTMSSPLQLSSDFVTALAQQTDATLWIGTLRGGVQRIAPDGRSLRSFRHDAGVVGSIGSNEVWGFIEDQARRLWIATDRGMCLVEGDRFRCHPLPRGAYAVDVDAEGWFWIARYMSGAVSFDPESGAYGDPIPIAPEVITVFVDRDSSYLWLAGSSLYRARIARGQLLEPLVRIEAGGAPERLIYELHRDTRGVLWLASGVGLQRWDSETRRFASIDVPELRQTTVFSVAEDAQGRLWLGTSHGLVYYSPVTGVARRFRKQDGVLSGEFTRRAALLLHNGEMLFGGVNGVTRFRPERVLARREAPPLVFTGWRKVTSRGLEDGQLDGDARLHLGPGDRALTVDFAALTFAHGPAKRYRYRLEGVSSDWIESGEHQVSYPAPPPGRYTLRVQAAAGSEGEWNEPGSSLAIQVVPPFWRTSWFNALVGALVLASLWVLHQLRLRRVLATERLRLRISRDLHDEIGAGLSSIALLSDSIGRAEAVTDRDRAQLRRISRSARDMVADLRDIVWAIDPDGDRLGDVIARMKDVASSLLRDVNVTFHTPPSGELAEKINMAARRDLLLAFKELLHNVARHSRASNVRIELNSRGNEVALVVSDDGVGFDDGGAPSGTGLKSVRERAARLGGRFEVCSARGRGTTARFTLQLT
jgi:signal transduction histidine kinase/streptogramin lyase